MPWYGIVCVVCCVFGAAVSLTVVILAAASVYGDWREERAKAKPKREPSAIDALRAQVDARDEANRLDIFYSTKRLDAQIQAIREAACKHRWRLAANFAPWLDPCGYLNVEEICGQCGAKRGRSATKKEAVKLIKGGGK